MKKRAMLALTCLLILLAAGCRKPEKPGGGESAPPSPEMTAPSPGRTAGAEADEASVYVTEIWQDACVFAVRNNGPEPFCFTVDYELARMEEGTWEDCEFLRAPEGAIGSHEVPAGETGKFVCDWSFPYGTLPPGRYRLKVWGNPGEAIWHQGSVTAEFELTGLETLPEPAPAPASAPEWCRGSLERVSEHKLSFRLIAEEGHKFRWDEDWSLFRKEGTAYILVPAAYRLTGISHITSRAELEWNVNLAAAYGELPAGEYLLRKRLLDLSAWPEERRTDWDLIAPEKLTLLEVPFTLEETLPDILRETDPYDWLLYVPGLPVEERVEVTYEDLSPAGITVWMKNTGEEELLAGFQWYLYFREGEEWFPAPLMVRGLYTNPGWALPPGEPRSQGIVFGPEWGELPPGDYRLVQQMNDGKLIFCEFRI